MPAGGKGTNRLNAAGGLTLVSVRIYWSGICWIRFTDFLKIERDLFIENGSPYKFH